MKKKQKFLFSNNLGWKKIYYENKTIIFKGYLYNDCFEKIIKNIFKVKDKSKYIKNLDGLFAFIIKDNHSLIAVVDRISSIPIFFQDSEKEIIFSNNSELIQKYKKNNLLQSSLNSYFMSGYTIGNSTIYENINRIEPGSYFEIYKSQKIKIKKYYNFEPWKYKVNKDIKILEKNYAKCNLKVFKKIKNYCEKNNSGLAVSLTAGYDSRLIVSMLKKIKFKDVICFTYGVKNNYEFHAAQKICKFLKFKHFFVEINNKKIKNIYQTNKYKEFIKNSDQGLSIIDTTEYVVINELVKRKLLKDRIILNGLSGDFISGGHQLEKFLDQAKSGINQTIDAIIKKHFKLWVGKNSLINERVIFRLLKDYFDKLKYKIKNKNNYGIIEHFDLYNRQSKYSLSRQQTYNYFKINWLLPHFDTEYLNFWQKIEPRLKTNQKFYDNFLRKKNYEKIWLDYEWYKLRLNRQKSFSIKLFFILILKVLFFFNKKKYNEYYVKYLDYFNQTLAGYGEFDYLSEVITHEDKFRNFISLKVKKYLQNLVKKYQIKVD